MKQFNMLKKKKCIISKFLVKNRKMLLIFLIFVSFKCIKNFKMKKNLYKISLELQKKKKKINVV